MTVLKVGELYVPGRTQWREAFEYNFDQSGHVLLMTYRKPSDKEIKAVSKGDISVALHIYRNLPFLCARFLGGIPWSDCPFCWWLVPVERRAIPQKIQGEQKVLLQIFLVDADTGILKAIRTVSLSTEMSIALHETIQKQIDGTEITPNDYMRISGEIASTYNSDRLAEIATIRYEILAKKKGFG